jgi:signal transduction histidine kinase
MDEKAEMQDDNEKTMITMMNKMRNALRLMDELVPDAFENDEHGRSMMQSYMKIVANNIARMEGQLKEVQAHKKSEIILQPVNICDCIDKALCEARDWIYLSGITVIKNYEGRHWVHGNEEKLLIAFWNVILNLIEASKTEQRKIWINVDEVDNTTRITFKDNGAGLMDGAANKIFDLNSRAKDGRGNGVFNVMEIMDLHKAIIVDDSLPGLGTSISILFTAIPEDEVMARSEK